MQLTFNFFSSGMGYKVLPITREDTKPFILEKHYAKRMPSVSLAFGLFHDDELVGVVTYGTPPSHTLLKGVCGVEFCKNVIELNRLVLKNNLKNEASLLVGRSLQMIGNKIVVSYADTTQGHFGYVYQATNFLYTGRTKPIKEIFLKSRPALHHTTHGGKTYAEMIAIHGEDVDFRLRSIKHRYVIFTGSKSFRNQASKAMKYNVSDYPKKHFPTVPK